MSFALEVSSQAAVDELELRKTVVWDLILRLLETFPDQAVRQADKSPMKQSIANVVNEHLANGEVFAVYITEFVMQ